MNTQHTEPTRKLSIIRLSIFIAVVYLIGYSVIAEWNNWNLIKADTPYEPWFAPYVDVTATPHYAFEQISAHQAQNMILSFIVSDTNDVCTPSWGAHYTLDEAYEILDLDRRIARYRQAGGEIGVSFGGLLNDELAVNCTNEQSLYQAYAQVIDRYDIEMIDLDLEGTGLTDQQAAVRRANVIVQLQHNYPDLSVWLTLPAATFGLTTEGTNSVATLLDVGVDIAGVNAMTMNYGASKEQGTTMADASEQALSELHRQLMALYAQHGTPLSSEGAWKKIGATPMIGQNDVTSEIFTFSDAQQLATFSQASSLSRLSMWSMNRDYQCGGNYVNVSIVSDGCSGITQEQHAFSTLFSTTFTGHINNYDPEAADTITPTIIKDNPTTSPYPIWSENSTYLQGTKIVWHGHVYEAKWWTQGDLPDHPVLQSWETPWTLIGPVLPGEKPVPQVILVDGTYPSWDGTTIFEAGERVLFNGVPYQAKWWTQGDSPAAASTNPDSSPWMPLSRAQIEAITESTKKD